jgi:hypothetical protein
MATKVRRLCLRFIARPLVPQVHPGRRGREGLSPIPAC